MRPRIRIDDDNPYLPLFQRGGTRYKIVLGGRGSGKSFSVATAIILRTYKQDDGPDNGDGTILYTRFTLTNAEISILPEFVDKIERLGLSGDFVKSGNDLINIRTGGRILFRGIKTSTGINTAALKSIPKLKLWVNDESEELVDETVFNTIDLSIRYANVPAEVWLVANPPSTEHFIYRRFFSSRGLDDVWNGVKDDVTYIHTTYLDNPFLPAEYVALAEKCKTIDPEMYDNVWLGHFATRRQGLIYKNWMKVDDTMWPTHLRCWYGCDWGWNDPTAIVRCTYDPETGIVWLKEICYRSEISTESIANTIKNDIYNRKRTIEVGHRQLVWEKGHLFYEGREIMLGRLKDDLRREGFDGWQASEVIDAVDSIQCYDGEIYCDPARPEQIRSLKLDFGLWAIEANNRDKFGRIQYIRYFDVCYIGDNLEHEIKNYRWKVNPKDKTKFIDEPQDGDDHLADSANYAITNHLRKLHIANKLGEK